MASITRVEVQVFAYEVPDLELPTHGAAGVGNVAYRQGGRMPCTRYAVTIDSSDGARGAYVTHWVGTPSALAQTLMLAPHLLGRDPDAREAIYDDLKREVRAYDHMGHGPLDIALWDLAGKRRGVSVTRLLGGFRTRLPTYASTYHAQEEPGGLDSPGAFADYALACKERGFAGFKIHGWHDGNARREAEGKAIGGACRHAARALEDCYQMNRKADKAAVFAGWREMNDYMRENKIEPQPAPPPTAAAPAEDAPADAEADDGHDKADKPAKGAKVAKAGDKH